MQVEKSNVRNNPMFIYSYLGTKCIILYMYLFLAASLLIYICRKKILNLTCNFLAENKMMIRDWERRRSFEVC